MRSFNVRALNVIARMLIFVGIMLVACAEAYSQIESKKLSVSDFSQRDIETITRQMAIKRYCEVEASFGCTGITFGPDVALTGSRLNMLSHEHQTIQTLTIGSKFVEPNALHQISKFRNLLNVGIGSPAVDNGIFFTLSKLKCLTSLYLSGTSVTGEGIDCLTPCPLKLLHLSGLDISSRGMNAIGQLKTLEDLDLSYTDLDNESLSYLSQLENLIWLDLSYSKFINLQPLVAGKEGMPRLFELNVRGSLVDDSLIDCLKKMPELETLMIGHSKVTEAGLMRLINIKQFLKVSCLEVCQDQLTEKGAEKLKEAFPMMQISISHKDGSRQEF